MNGQQCSSYFSDDGSPEGWRIDRMTDGDVTIGAHYRQQQRAGKLVD